ncbi:MAG: hypothetical protein KC457_17875 [Myxococcales bacterium]|nr:hypothetical protein [Myxococcales bacterium]
MPASTVHAAANSGLLDPRLSPWSEDVPAGQLYVERPSDWTSHPGGPALPLAQRLRRRLLATDAKHFKILFTGQVGSGKSSELERLYRDPEITGHFERLRFIASIEQIDLKNGDTQQLLIALAAGIARHIVDNKLHEHGDSEKLDKGLRRWIELLNKLCDIEPPNQGEAPAINFGAVFFKFSARLRTESELRDKIRGERRLAVIELRELVGDLLDAVRERSERPLLLFFDDLDKVSLEFGRDLFIDHIESLMALPCNAVITYPYALNYDERFEIGRVSEPVRLENVKTIVRPEPGHSPGPPVAGAVEFFSKLLAHRIDLGLIDEDALREAVAHCAGIPREFMRIVQRAFLLADEYERERIEKVDVESAIRYLRREASLRTQRASTRAALIRIHQSGRLAEDEDWELLQALLVVEYTNDLPWYDVHPILRTYIDELIAEGL